MIISVTMNPSVDISYRLEEFRLNGVNRVENVLKTAGGKGLNVARVVHLLNSPVMATGILGGTIGDFIESQLQLDGISHDFLKTDQESRNCIAILHDGNQTEILEAGPTFSKQEEMQFLQHYSKLLEKGEVVTISGSLPRGLEASLYSQMILLAKQQQIPVILDCSEKILKQVLDFQEARPLAIKPNIDELNELLNLQVSADDINGLREAVSHSCFSGIDWVLVSLGAKGAFIKYLDDYYFARIPKVPVVNPVGSGDSVVAGLAVAILQKKTVENVIKTAMTTGVLNAMETQTGFVNSEKFDFVYSQIEIQKIM
ncbi:1-phosphofructokinase [Heyndrickxia shackletonii]|uniref:Tagatose-6-phosphate kinase n=1 Tax=Heyndrickxia shackletonii TaxID=157838 RepID=A0A0Q3WVT3_9BACI|nr:hexose kinase [Heyndrickxia shackletonii]KQL52917.1 1-phosphofructokinase [Heyndrickxia shackletonii]NEY98901.1 hexose kinase [Heyndrickxia shackletonii]